MDNELRVTRIVIKGWHSSKIVEQVAEPKIDMDTRPIHHEGKCIKRTIEAERACQYPDFKGMKIHDSPRCEGYPRRIPTRWALADYKQGQGRKHGD